LPRGEHPGPFGGGDRAIVEDGIGAWIKRRRIVCFGQASGRGAGADQSWRSGRRCGRTVGGPVEGRVLRGRSGPLVGEGWNGAWLRRPREQSQRGQSADSIRDVHGHFSESTRGGRHLTGFCNRKSYRQSRDRNFRKNHRDRQGHPRSPGLPERQRCRGVSRRGGLVAACPACASDALAASSDGDSTHSQQDSASERGRGDQASGRKPGVRPRALAPDRRSGRRCPRRRGRAGSCCH